MEFFFKDKYNKLMNSNDQMFSNIVKWNFYFEKKYNKIETV
jgi:hypothetical protein